MENLQDTYTYIYRPKNIAYTIINKTRNFQDSIKTWNRMNPVQQHWTDFENHLRTASASSKKQVTWKWGMRVSNKPTLSMKSYQIWTVYHLLTRLQEFSSRLWTHPYPNINWCFNYITNCPDWPRIQCRHGWRIHCHTSYSNQHAVDKTNHGRDIIKLSCRKRPQQLPQKTFFSLTIHQQNPDKGNPTDRYHILLQSIAGNAEIVHTKLQHATINHPYIRKLLPFSIITMPVLTDAPNKEGQQK